MDILIFNKTLLKVLAIWPTETFAFANWTISRLIRYVGLLLLFVVTITSCVAYSIQNIDDIVECTSAMYVSLAFTTSVCTYCALIYHRERIQLVLTKIQAIVMIRTSGGSNLVASGSRPLYENIEFSYTSMCKRFVHYWIVIVGAFSVFLIAVPVYYVIMGRSDVENWNPAYKTVLPFESFGVRIFFVQLLCHIFLTFAHFVIYSAIGTFHIGTALYVSTMSTDIGRIISNIRSAIVERSPHRVSTKKSLLYQAVKFHGELIEIRESLKEIMSAVLFVKIVNMGIFFAVCLLQMEVGLKNPKPELYISFNSVCINIVVVYSDCYYANLVTDRTTQIADDAYSCPWYTYTTCMKKSIALLIQQSQKSFYYTGLGLMHCTLATFSMTLNSAVSYFLLLKSL